MRLRWIVAGVVFAAVSSAASAAQRTFVSVSGNDANAASSCSLAAPCRSFASAIGVTDADGEVVVLDSGGYGPVTITQGVTITAPPGVYAGVSVFASPGTGVNINAPGAKVMLRGLTINGQGGSTGIYAPQADEVVIDRCVVTNLTQNGLRADTAAHRIYVTDTVFDNAGQFSLDFADLVSLERVRVTRGGIGGEAVAFRNVKTGFMHDVRVVESTSSGIGIFTTTPVRSDVTLESVYVADSAGNGIAASTAATGSTVIVTIRNSDVVHNATSNPLLAGIGSGAGLAASVVRTTVENTVVSGNGVGISVSQSGGGAASISVANSQIVDNAGFGLQNGGAVMYTRGNNTIRGNNGAETTSQTSGTITSLGGV